jgi:hypothetical protein
MTMRALSSTTSAAPRAPLGGARAVTRRRAPERFAREAGVAIAGLALFAAPLPFLLRFDSTHVITATLLSVLLCGLTLASRQAGIIATAVFLAALGDYRRYAGFFEGYPESDPLLLVAPVAALFLLGCAFLEGRVRASTGTSKLVLGLMALMFLEIFNPLQGGTQVGFAGALFYLVPLVWFWIGRAYPSPEFMRRFTLHVVLPIGLIATLWGLWQTRNGLLEFERQWVGAIGYGALYISDDVIRAIGFFNSSAEYQRYLLLTAVILLAAWLRDRSWSVLLWPIVGVTIFLSAARGPVVVLVGTTVVLWAVSVRTTFAWLPRAVLGAALGVGLLVMSLAFLRTVPLGERFAPLVTRQVEGLLDPANQKKSTATGHLLMVRESIVAGLTSPAGQGLGATTIAADKYGAKTTNAEFDVANVTLSLGIFGGLLYLVIVLGVYRKALRWWQEQRSVVALATIGVLLVTFGAWLTGSEYSTAALVWFYIGAMDKLSVEQRIERVKKRAHSADHA